MKKLAFDKQGRCLHLHDDSLIALGARLTGTRGVPVRASHVEPDAAGQWSADLAPVGGPKLGPFDTRADALAAEIVWLNRYRL